MAKLQNLIDLWGEVGTTVDSASQRIQDFDNKVSGIVSTANNISIAVDVVGQSGIIDELSASYSAIRESTSSMIEGATSSIGEIYNAFEPELSMIRDEFNSNYSEIVEFTSSMIKGVTSSANEIYKSFEPELNFIKDKFSTTFELLVTKVQAVTSKIGDKVAAAIEPLTAKAESVVTSVKEKFNSMKEKIKVNFAIDQNVEYASMDQVAASAENMGSSAQGVIDSTAATKDNALATRDQFLATMECSEGVVQSIGVTWEAIASGDASTESIINSVLATKESIMATKESVMGTISSAQETWNSVGAMKQSIGTAWESVKAFKNVAASTKAAAIAQKIFNFIMNLNPIILIVTAVMILVGALIYLYTHSETARKIMDKLWSGMKKGAEVAINGVIKVINFFIRALNKIKLPDWLGGGGFEIKEINEVKFTDPEKEKKMVDKASGAKEEEYVSKIKEPPSIGAPEGMSDINENIDMSSLDFTSANNLSPGETENMMQSTSSVKNYDNSSSNNYEIESLIGQVNVTEEADEDRLITKLEDMLKSELDTGGAYAYAGV